MDDGVKRSHDSRSRSSSQRVKKSSKNSTSQFKVKESVEYKKLWKCLDILLGCYFKMQFLNYQIHYRPIIHRRMLRMYQLMRKKETQKEESRMLMRVTYEWFLQPQTNLIAGGEIILWKHNKMDT